MRTVNKTKTQMKARNVKKKTFFVYVPERNAMPFWPCICFCYNFQSGILMFNPLFNPITIPNLRVLSLDF